MRGLAVLQLFTIEKPELSLTEIAALMGLTRSATYRLTYNLETTWFLSRVEGGKKCCATGLVLSLGFQFLYARTLVEVAQPILKDLSARTQAASYLSELDGPEVVQLLWATPAAALVGNLQVSRRLPAHARATGRIILAYRKEAELQKLYRDVKKSKNTTLLPVSS
ncbi:MAG: IclR family transcriptional regulator [Cypionkella sp.]